MTFHILQIREGNSARDVSLAKFSTLNAANDEVINFVDSLDGSAHGFDPIGGFWWYCDDKDRVIGVYVDEIPAR
jgi:hypothetical protein